MSGTQISSLSHAPVILNTSFLISSLSLNLSSFFTMYISQMKGFEKSVVLLRMEIKTKTFEFIN